MNLTLRGVLQTVRVHLQYYTPLEEFLSPPKTEMKVHLDGQWLNIPIGIRLWV